MTDQIAGIKAMYDYTLEKVMKVLDKGAALIPDEHLQYKASEKTRSVSSLYVHIYQMAYMCTVGAVNGKFTHEDFNKIAIDPSSISDTKELLGYGEKIKPLVREYKDKIMPEMLDKTINFDFSNAPKDHLAHGWGNFSVPATACFYTVNEEAIHHRGQIFLILRILGIPPPFIYDTS